MALGYNLLQVVIILIAFRSTVTPYNAQLPNLFFPSKVNCSHLRDLQNIYLSLVKMLCLNTNVVTEDADVIVLYPQHAHNMLLTHFYFGRVGGESLCKERIGN